MFSYQIRSDNPSLLYRIVSLPWPPILNIHLNKKINPRQFLKLTLCKYPTTVNNSEICIFLQKPCPLMWYLTRGNHVRNGRDRCTVPLPKVALFENSVGEWNHSGYCWDTMPCAQLLMSMLVFYQKWYIFLKVCIEISWLHLSML